MSNMSYMSQDEQLANKMKSRGKIRFLKNFSSKLKNIKLNKKSIAAICVVTGTVVGVVSIGANIANKNRNANLSTPNSTTSNMGINNVPGNNTNNKNNDTSNNNSNNSNTSNNNSNNGNTANNNSNNKKEPLKTGAINSLGVELELPKKDTPKKEYSNPTGNVKVDEIVEDNTGKLWVNSEAESKKDNVDKVVIDDNNSKYEVKPNGDVYQKEPEYQIVDNNGNVTSEGTSDIMSDYAWDPTIGKYLPKDEVGKYVITPDGDMSEYEKYLESLKNENTSSTVETEFIPMDPIVVDTEFVPIDNDTLTSSGTIVGTNKDENTSSTSDSQANSDDEITLDGGKEMPDGTYSVGGLVFESKEDYEQWILQDFEGYGIVNGIMIPKTDEMLEADKKVRTR